jgi:hypothetical protein
VIIVTSASLSASALMNSIRVFSAMLLTIMARSAAV